ncbi:MAG TPA: hypothetical protein VF091_05040 [Gaiellaceae bacterium]
MARRLGSCLVVLVALAVVPGAIAAFPGPYGLQGGAGVPGVDGTVSFTAVKAAGGTLVSAVSTDGGAVLRSRTFDGQWGIPTIQYGKPGEGMSRDGKTFVLENVGLAETSKFMLVSTSDLSTVDSFTLNGTYAFDALSPTGSMMYLIQHKTTQDFEHYIVRGYDLRAHALLSQRIADKTQKSWVMQGWAVTRTTSPNGRWVYTLYANPGGYPFVHALDTVKGVAHCVGLPWPATNGQQGAVFNFTLALKGHTLAVRYQGGSVYRTINTTSWKVSRK